jgi:ABC-type transport system involved in multi-copper enzyme maturation permease subunit
LDAALRAEWTKFRTVRGWILGLLLAAAMVVLFSYLQAHGKQTGYCTTPNPDSCVTGHLYVPTGPDGEAVADSYELVSRALTGDGTISAQIASLTGRIQAGPAGSAPTVADTTPGLASWAKAGLLITPSTKQGASYAAVMATGGHGIRFQYDYTHDQAGLPGPVDASTPRWLRLTRSGDTLTGYDSADGVSWHRIGSTVLPELPHTVQIGLFTTSPVTYTGRASRTTARFEHIAISSPVRDAGVERPWHGSEVGGGQRSFYTTLGNGSYRHTGGSISVTGSGDIAPAVVSVGGDTASGSLLFGLVVAMLVLIVIATMFMTSEYRHGLIRTTLAAKPHRGQVLVAKAIVIGSVGFIVGAAASAAAIPLTEHLVKANGNYVFPAGALALAQAIAGSGALVGLTGVALLGVGTLMRRSAGAIMVGVVVFILPAFLGPGVLGGPSSSSGTLEWLYRITPAAGFSMLGLLPRSSLVSYPYTMGNGYYPLPSWAGLLVLCAYATIALLAAGIAFMRRDA